MHHLSSVFSFGAHGDGDALSELGGEDSAADKRPHRRPSLLKRPFHVFKRHHSESNVPDRPRDMVPSGLPDVDEDILTAATTQPPDYTPRRVVPSLPRPQTFRRQESEKREKLLEVPPSLSERRTASTDRRLGRTLSANAVGRAMSPQPVPMPSISAASVGHSAMGEPVPTAAAPPTDSSTAKPSQSHKDLPPLQIPDDVDDQLLTDDDCDDESHVDQLALEKEFDRRWILNLSMHFRDKSNREKFFVTYAETPNQWRRVTISLDYRNAAEESLEADLSTLHFQRDKSLRIYEAIRESLPDIQYYDTVTNLKLETTPEDNQLHVHVREDANEIIHYPDISLFDHVRCPRFNETSLEFDSHLSGFVYKVRLGHRVVIKKEIPGPDTIDEFLYEVNALDALLGCENVVQLEGLVTNDRGTMVKALLISYASQGALVDMIYDFRGTGELTWPRREKWARQIVNGLAQIHEGGFVQGDFTLSNIVIDADDNASIIDINRRGCPVGWEPPELSRLIDSGQRIGMCIGVKTDLYQLGMVLWALAEEVDEPERVERQLPDVHDGIPQYFHDLVKICLSERPQGRLSAKELLRAFPSMIDQTAMFEQRSLDYPSDRMFDRVSDLGDDSGLHRSDKEYIDPTMAVTIDDVRDRRRSLSEIGDGQVSYVHPDSNPGSTSYRFDSNGSWVIGRRSRTSRGRSPVSSRRRPSSPCNRSFSSTMSLSDRSQSRPKIYEGDGGDDDGGRVALDESVTLPPRLRMPEPTDEEQTRGGVESSASAPCQDRDGWCLQENKPLVDLQHIDSGFYETMDGSSVLRNSERTIKAAEEFGSEQALASDGHDDADYSKIALQTTLHLKEPDTTANEELTNGASHNDNHHAQQHDYSTNETANDDSIEARMPGEQHGQLESGLVS